MTSSSGKSGWPVVKSTILALRKYIESSSLAKGDRLPSENDLASLLKVSRGTVRRAIEELIQTGEIERQRHARPVVGDAAEVSQIHHGINVHVWTSKPIVDESTLVFLRGISSALQGTRHRMLICEPSRHSTESIQKDEERFFDLVLADPNAAGAIVVRDPFAEDSPSLAKLIQRGVPLVFVDTPAPEGIPADYVGSTNTVSASKCVGHLIGLGHTRIACVVDTDIPAITQQRIRGYLRSMEQAKLSDLASLIVASKLPPAETSLAKAAAGHTELLLRGYFGDLATRVVSHILGQEQRPTSIFVNCDMLAIPTIQGLEASGLSIPKDMSVVGFDWLAGRDDQYPDSLTTANQDFEGFGYHAAHLILDKLSGESPLWPRMIMLDAPLVVRSSTTRHGPAGFTVAKPTESGEISLT